MSTVAPAVPIAIRQAGRAGLHCLADLRCQAAAAAAHAHPNAAPVLLLALAVVFIAMVTRMVTRINSELVNIFSHLIQTAAAVGRMLLVILVIGVLALVVLLHL